MMGRGVQTAWRELRRRARAGRTTRLRSLSFAQPNVSISGDTKHVVITPGVDKDGMPLPPASAVCFFLHGLGDTASSFAGMFHQLSILLPHVKFILPTAKPMAVTCNQGAEMPSWYDLHGISNRAAEQCHGIEDSRALLDHMIGLEIEGGISERRIVVGGFSQGGACALYTGIRQPHGLAGILGLSCYLPLPQLTKDLTLSPAAKSTPILLSRGSEDEVVVPQDTADAAAVLTKAGYKVDLKTVTDLGHSVDPEVIQNVANFLKRTLPR